MISKAVLSRLIRSSAGLALCVSLLSACSAGNLALSKGSANKVVVGANAQLRSGEIVPLAFSAGESRAEKIGKLIMKYATTYDVPEELVHRVIDRESDYNPGARNGPYYGLMQIRHDTAQSMGYRGSAKGLLDAETNLKYAIKYLRGAYIVGDYDYNYAIRNYSRGYYYEAKRKGLLDLLKKAGLR